MSKQTNKFARAARAAKKLYKTGRYKRYSDAVAAAYKKLSGTGGSKTRQTGSSNRKADRKRKAKPPGKRKSASGKTYYERRKNRSDVPGKLSGASAATLTRELVARKKTDLGKLLLRRELCGTKRDRKKISKRITEVKHDIKKLL